MTYNIRDSRSRAEIRDPDAILKVVDSAAPDIVALQGIDSETASLYADILGLQLCLPPYSKGTAVLSSFPCKGAQEFDLGFGGTCLKLDVEVGGKRLHFFNVDLSKVSHVPAQIRKLLSADILSHRNIVCPVVIVGDFSLSPWLAVALRFCLDFRKIPTPLWSSTFPAPFPLIPTARAYVRGDIRAIDSRVIRSSVARHASSTLPLVMTLRLEDPRSYIKLKKFRQNRMEVAPG